MGDLPLKPVRRKAEPHPLWMPPGSIRGLLTIIIVISAMIFQLYGKMDDQVWNLVMLAVSVYFVSRNSPK